MLAKQLNIDSVILPNVFQYCYPVSFNIATQYVSFMLPIVFILSKTIFLPQVYTIFIII